MGKKNMKRKQKELINHSKEKNSKNYIWRIQETSSNFRLVTIKSMFEIFMKL